MPTYNPALPPTANRDLTGDNQSSLAAYSVADEAGLATMAISALHLGRLVQTSDKNELYLVVDVGAVGIARFKKFGLGADLYETSASNFEIPTLALLNPQNFLKNSGGNDATFTTEGSETIDGAASLTLGAYENAILISVDGNHELFSVGGSGGSSGGGGSSSGNSLPVADFNVSLGGAGNMIATYTNNSTDPDGTIDSQLWTMHDNSTYTAVTPPPFTHTTVGQKTVSLSVTDNDGDTNTTTKTYTITSAVTPLTIPGKTPTMGFRGVGLALADGAALTPLVDTQGNYNLSPIGANAVYDGDGIGAADFGDASHGELPIGSESSLKYLHDVGATCTLLFCVKIYGGGYNTLFETNDTDVPGVYIYSIGDGDRFRSEWCWDASINPKIRTTNPLQPSMNAWATLAFVVNGNSQKIYINGVEIDSNGALFAGQNIAHSIMKIGNGAHVLLRDFQSYNSALTAAEISGYHTDASNGNYLV